jgi:two-component system chemotaxis sensor kinase CheA
MHDLLNNEASAMAQCSAFALLLHTYKGNFAQFGFLHLPPRLHELETQLETWKQRLRSAPSEPELSASLAEWLRQLDLLGLLADDMRILQGVLGDRFLGEENKIMIEAERLRQLEQRVLTLYPGPEAEALVSDIHLLKCCTFGELLSMYPAYVEQLARQTGKELEPLTLEGGDILVDPNAYSDFSRSLTHVFRNMIDHGIELPEERMLMGKSPRGRIRCGIIATEQQIELRLSNDGNPIDLAVVRSRALEQGLCTAEQFDAMSADAQRMLITQEGFSSKRTVTSLSGRGIGLSAVRKALEALNGTMRIDSDAEYGTTFTFLLPRALTNRFPQASDKRRA